MSRPSSEGLLGRTTVDPTAIEPDEDEKSNFFGMGVSLSTARWAVPASMIFNVGCQFVGMGSDPSMKQVADMNHAYLSPQPMFIAGFFFPQILIQGVWVYDLIYGKPKQTSLNYAGYFIVGEVAIGIWMLFFMREQFVPAGLCCVLNTGAQLIAMTQLPKWNSPGNLLPNLVCRMMAGIGVLDLLDSYGTAYLQGQTPGLVTKALTFAGFTGWSLFSDPIFGASLIFDTAALYFGQSGSWANWLGATALATTAGVVARNLLM